MTIFSHRFYKNQNIKKFYTLYLTKSSNIRNYIGEEVPYNSPKGGTWRVFYYDDTGYFGKQNTLYLKMDCGESLNVYNAVYGGKIYDGALLTKKMNPSLTLPTKLTKNSEFGCYFLCDSSQWTDYKTNDSSYAIGGPSIEMFVKSYNIWKTGKPDNGPFKYSLYGSFGFKVELNRTDSKLFS